MRDLSEFREVDLTGAQGASGVINLAIAGLNDVWKAF